MTTTENLKDLEDLFYGESPTGRVTFKPQYERLKHVLANPCYDLLAESVTSDSSAAMPATASSVPIAQPMSERERALCAAARNAAGAIKLHLWRYNAPSDKWPEGSWAADDARDAHKQLKAALAAYEGEGK